MLGAYVCRKCRTRLSRHIAPLRTPQWQPRATFISLRSQIPQDETTTAQPQHEPAAAQSDTQTTPKAPETSNESLRIRVGRYSALVQGDTHDGTGPLIQRTSSGGEGRGPAASITDLLTKGRLDTAWRIFEKHYTSKDCGALVDPPESDVALLKNGKVFEDLLKRVNGAFCKGKTDLAVTPTMVLFKYEQLGLARPEHWARLTLGFLTHYAIVAANAPTGEGESVRDLPSLLLELLSVWRLFFQAKGVNRAPMESISNEWNLPAVTDLPEFFESKAFHVRLQELHPNFLVNPVIGFCAVYLYNLSDALAANEALQQEATPFIQILGRLLAGSYVNGIFVHTTQSKLFQQLNEDTKKEILNEINAAPGRALREIGSTGESLGEEQTTDPAANLEAYHLKRIARAVQSKNSADVLERIWKNVLEDFQENGKSTIPPRVYNAFLSGFMIVLRAQRSVEVWNHMMANGVQPDVQSWVALLEGCSKSRDLDGFNAMWTRMLNAGIEPDNYAWTTRIHGLFAMRRYTQGLAALDDMAKRWLAAENAIRETQSNSRNSKTKPASVAKATNTCTKPSIEVINAAISALVQLPLTAMPLEKRVDYVQKILSWASGFQIKPDVVTYNSLIRLYMRQGDAATAFKFLGQMETDGIAADIATYTMLLAAAFDNASFSELSNEEQAKKVIAIMTHIEQSGMKLNEYVYSTAINKLLKQYSNYDAAMDVMRHMHQRNLVASAHLYTVLVTYYFQQTPPAIAAVDGLVHQILTSHRVPADRVLFDRILEGYAAHGETAKMTSVLDTMSKHGRVPGWRTLSTIVQALLRDGDEAKARAIVRDVENEQGIAKGGVTGGSQAQSRFFTLVRETGLGARDQKMGDMWNGDRAEQASSNEAGLDDRSRPQEREQMTHDDQVQDFASFSKRTTKVVFEKEQKEPVTNAIELEEEVHEFLVDEQDVPSRARQS